MPPQCRFVITLFTLLFVYSSLLQLFNCGPCRLELFLYGIFEPVDKGVAYGSGNRQTTVAVQAGWAEEALRLPDIAGCWSPVV